MVTRILKFYSFSFYIHFYRIELNLERQNTLTMYTHEHNPKPEIVPPRLKNPKSSLLGLILK